MIKTWLIFNASKHLCQGVRYIGEAQHKTKLKAVRKLRFKIMGDKWCCQLTLDLCKDQCISGQGNSTSPPEFQSQQSQRTSWKTCKHIEEWISRGSTVEHHIKIKSTLLLQEKKLAALCRPHLPMPALTWCTMELSSTSESPLSTMVVVRTIETASFKIDSPNTNMFKIGSTSRAWRNFYQKPKEDELWPEI